MEWARFLPFLDLKNYSWNKAYKDFVAALAVTFMGVPQGIAYAVIAGLPPAMGLYASTVPTITGSLFRSSHHVVTGPTNAVSLLVGGGIALVAGKDPVVVAITLALMVGVFQFVAGVLRLGSIVDYISNPVVLGYITGAGLLIGIGQLPNVTATNPTAMKVPLFSSIWSSVQAMGPMGWLIWAALLAVILGLLLWRKTRSYAPSVLLAAGISLLLALQLFPSYNNAFQKIVVWVKSLNLSSYMALSMAGGTALFILLLRKFRRSWPGALLAMAIATALSMIFDLHSQGMRIVSDLRPVPAGFPPLTYPDLSLMAALAPLAFATTVLSLVESSAVARAIAARTGQRLDISADFSGQGIANISAAFFGGYPTSGSLSRSAFNEQSGAVTRLAGVMSGFFMIAVLLILGPLANYTPIASLAGLLVVVAFDLIDVKRIRATMNSNLSDKMAFLVTVFGTWMMPLDKAIYLGVGVSLILFLRQARLLVVRDLTVDSNQRLREVDVAHTPDDCSRCKSIHILHLEGRLFFGVEGELQSAMDRVIHDRDVKVLVVRLKRTQGMDVTTANTFAAAAERMREQGRLLVLAGVRQDALRHLEEVGTLDILGKENVFPSRTHWLDSMKEAMIYACQFAGEALYCETCPLKDFLQTHDEKAWKEITKELPPEDEYVADVK
ncbi:MAG: SulP family inorganic anion transporter [Deltaproteobacteria bacterium]|nr:MAG: SulP family inorganic anion transporter [Deltaproteobacteria bacterium]